MSTTHGISGAEIAFALAALLMSVLAGFVLVPVLRKALAEGGSGPEQETVGAGGRSGAGTSAASDGGASASPDHRGGDEA